MRKSIEKSRKTDKKNLIFLHPSVPSPPSSGKEKNMPNLTLKATDLLYNILARAELNLCWLHSQLASLFLIAARKWTILFAHLTEFTRNIVG